MPYLSGDNAVSSKRSGEKLVAAVAVVHGLLLLLLLLLLWAAAGAAAGAGAAVLCGVEQPSATVEGVSRRTNGASAARRLCVSMRSGDAVGDPGPAFGSGDAGADAVGVRGLFITSAGGGGGGGSGTDGGAVPFGT